MLWMSGAALNKGKIWHHKPILTRNNSLCFSVPAILEMLSIMIMVVCRCGGGNILNIPFRKFLQSHFVKSTAAVFYLAINKVWLLPCPVYFYHSLVKKLLDGSLLMIVSGARVEPRAWLLLVGRDCSCFLPTSVTTPSAEEHGHHSTSSEGRGFKGNSTFCTT